MTSYLHDSETQCLKAILNPFSSVTTVKIDRKSISYDTTFSYLMDGTFMLIEVSRDQPRDLKQLQLSRFQYIIF